MTDGPRPSGHSAQRSTRASLWGSGRALGSASGTEWPVRGNPWGEPCHVERPSEGACRRGGLTLILQVRST